MAEEPSAPLSAYSQVTVTFNAGAARTVVIFAGFTSNAGQPACIHVDEWSSTA